MFITLFTVKAAPQQYKGRHLCASTTKMVSRKRCNITGYLRRASCKMRCNNAVNCYNRMVSMTGEFVWGIGGMILREGNIITQ